MKHKFWSRRNLILVIIAIIVLGIGGYYLYARKYAVWPQISVSWMDEVAEPIGSDRVLIISPHPDDETIASGGYIVRAAKNGAKVEILLVTDGNRRGFGTERHQELKDAAKTLGIFEDNIEYLELPEYYLKEKISENDLASKIKAKILAFQPTIIFYPDQSDQNPDHQFIGQTLDNTLPCMVEISSAKRYTYLVHFKYFPQPVGSHPDDNLTPPVKLADFSHHWQKFILTSGEENTKSAALSVYKTQLRTPLLHDLLESMVRRNELFSTR